MGRSFFGIALTRPLRVALILGTIAVLAVQVVSLLIDRHEYIPRDLLTLIHEASLDSGLDPALGEALVRVESGGDPEAVSPRGALGLTQLMPETGRWLAGRSGLSIENDDDLLDPRLNVRLGFGYLVSLIREHDGDERLALAAYNAGPGRVAQWRRDHPDLDAPALLERVAYEETRRHVARVLQIRDRLRSAQARTR